MTITKKRNAAMFLAALMIALLCMILVALDAAADKHRDHTVALYGLPLFRRLLDDRAGLVLACALANLFDLKDSFDLRILLCLVKRHADQLWYDELCLHRLTAKNAAENRMPQKRRQHDCGDDCARDRQCAAKPSLFFRLVFRFLRCALCARRHCMHGGDVLRRLVLSLTVQILDGKVEIHFRILAEFLKVCKHGIGRGITLIQIGCHRLHADQLQRLRHLCVDLARRERHGG